MSFDFNTLKELLKGFSGCIKNGGEGLQARRQELSRIQTELHKIFPFAVSLGDDAKSSIEAYNTLYLLIDAYIAMQQGTFGGIKSASNFINQCRKSLEYMQCIHKGKIPFHAETFREFYADVFCDFEMELAREIGIIDSPCTFECHEQSGWYCALQTL